MSERINRDPVIQALTIEIWRHRPQSGLISAPTSVAGTPPRTASD